MISFDVRGALVAALIVLVSAPAYAQHVHGAAAAAAQEPGMLTLHLGSGWRAIGMAQAFPIVTTGLGSDVRTELTDAELYLTQPAVMFNLESPGARLVLRTTLNFEGLTQESGELTFGGWGEGFIDRRHPHTLLHEAMLSVNFHDVAGGALSVSAGKGFAPYGTDDPMSRPVLKYPTNHHLSQVLERWTVNGVFLHSDWSVEAGLFDGTEPDGPYDYDNFREFPNSWSVRLTRRFARGWEMSASYADVTELHHGEQRSAQLMNAYVRHETEHSIGRLYALVEASCRESDEDDGYFAIVGEAQVARGRHRPYARVELATRPEYERNDTEADGFFRYEHGAHPVGATRWLIVSAGYGVTATGLPWSVRPFVEVQLHDVATERGAIDARELFGTSRFFALTAGARIFLGGEPMRMGSYGVLDAITTHGGAHAGH